MKGLTVASGILMVATAAFCFINPGQTFMTMAFVVGTVCVISGVIHALAYLIGRGVHNKGDNNGWILIEALLTLFLGILILFNQITVDIAIPMIFGMWVLVSGMLRVEAATRINREIKPRNFKAVLITGIVSIIVGLFGFTNPLGTYVSVIILLGIFMLVQGINAIELGINMPHQKKEEEIKLFKKPREAVKIVDEIHESPEAVAERLKAQKEQEKEAEFVIAMATENIGLSREEAAKVYKETEEELKAAMSEQEK